MKLYLIYRTWIKTGERTEVACQLCLIDAKQYVKNNKQSIVKYEIIRDMAWN